MANAGVGGVVAAVINGGAIHGTVVVVGRELVRARGGLGTAAAAVRLGGGGTLGGLASLRDRALRRVRRHQRRLWRCTCRRREGVPGRGGAAACPVALAAAAPMARAPILGD